MGVYLDFNASAPIDPDVLECMIRIYQGTIGNADSRTHEFGEAARKIVEEARGSVASVLGVKNDEVFFTSGATESNNIAFQGLRDYAAASGKKHIITTAIEHKAVLETAKALQKEGFDVDFVKPDLSGRVNAEEIKTLVRADTLLVSMMHVNNETGVIQPVEEIGGFLAEKKILFHIDATQSFGKLIEELRRTQYDLLSMSAHKISGPQGVGALVMRRKRYKLPPVKGIMFGGQQEHGIRPGTIPVALVAGLGKACELCLDRYHRLEKDAVAIKKMILDMLETSGLRYSLNGDPEHCISTTINLCLHGISSEALMLSTKQYCGISNGSACNSTSYEPSYVLTAMGVPVDDIECSVRLSWGSGTDIEDIHLSIQSLLEVARDLA